MKDISPDIIERRIALLHPALQDGARLSAFPTLEIEEGEKSDTWPLVTDDGTGVDKLYLFGAIVGETERLMFEDYWPNDVSGSQVTKLLADYEGERLEVVINCPGGIVNEGAVIYEALKSLQDEKGVKLTAFIAGIAASAATYVMYAGDKLEMGSMAEVFVHPPQSGVYGGAKQMRSMAEELDKVEGNLLSVYKNARGLDLYEAIHADSGIGEGTFFNAEEARKKGIVDGIRKQEKAEAKEKPKAQAKAATTITLLTNASCISDIGLPAVPAPAEADNLKQGAEPTGGAALKALRKQRRDQEVLLGLRPK